MKEGKLEVTKVICLGQNDGKSAKCIRIPFGRVLEKIQISLHIRAD